MENEDVLMASGGFIKIDRKLLDWRFAQYPAAVALWIRLLLRANWQDGYFMGQEVPRGSLAASVKTLADETGLAEKTVRRWIQKFEKSGEIKTKSTNRFTLITIQKYDEFQNPTGSEVTKQVTNQMTEQVTNQVTKRVTKQVTNNRRNKERKNLRNEEDNAREPSASPARSSSESQEDEALRAELLAKLKGDI